MKKIFILLVTFSNLISFHAKSQCETFAGADYTQGIVFIMENNKIVWQHKAHESNDITLLPNGNILFTTGKGVLEVTRQNDTIFQYTSTSPIFACQRLKNGNTFIGECATGRLLELTPGGKIISEVNILPQGTTDGGFAFMRNARKLDNGNYLVAHYGDETVKEYSPEGKTIWDIKIPGGPHSVIRLPNGNTLVSVADKTKNPRITELNRNGETVWEFSNNNVPGKTLKFIGGMQNFPDGRILFTNWTGHENPAERTHLYLINREKEILCTLGNHEGIQTMSSVSVPASPARNTYTNPVIAYSLPDPTILKAADGYYYLYATEDIRNLPIHRSANLIDWEYVGTAFTDQTRPTFVDGGGIWAPDISYINGKYVLHYSMSVWGGHWTSGIGAAISDRPEGPFTDKGPIFISKEIGVENSIDQFYIEDSGRKYLFWGSFHGLYAIELTDDGLAIRPGAQKKQVAGTAYEGVYIHKHGGYYYMFASIGSCCEGVNSTYTTVVGRSKDILGPYLDKAGNPMLENNHEILIRANDRFVGTGHNSEIIADSEGTDWILYHGVDKQNPAGRVLLMDKINWTNGWLEIKNQSPSLQSNAPVFN